MASPSLLDQAKQFSLVHDLAEELGVRPELVHAVVQQESGGNPQARSKVGPRS